MATRKKRVTKSAAKTKPARKKIAKRAVAKKAARTPRAATARKTRVKAHKKTRAPAKKKPIVRAKAANRATAPRERVAKPRPEQVSKAPSASIDPSLFPCGDEALRAATGKGWNEWLAVLDASGASAQAFDHHRILDLALQSLPESAGWWAQMISVGYERVRGLREKHESCNGEFQATLSKTFSVPLFAAFAAWADATLRQGWLDAPGLSFTKLNAGKNIRARWPNGALLDIRFNATAPDKCQIVVDTMKLDDAAAVQQAKAFWQTQFERLQGYLRG